MSQSREAMLADAGEWHSLCLECGPNVAVDEDGCCAACGATAIGSWLDKLRAAPPEPPTTLSRTHVRGPGNLGFATCGRRYPDARFVEAGPSCKVCRHILEKREARHAL